MSESHTTCGKRCVADAGLPLALSSDMTPLSSGRHALIGGARGDVWYVRVAELSLSSLPHANLKSRHAVYEPPAWQENNAMQVGCTDAYPH